MGAAAQVTVGEASLEESAFSEKCKRVDQGLRDGTRWTYVVVWMAVIKVVDVLEATEIWVTELIAVDVATAVGWR